MSDFKAEKFRLSLVHSDGQSERVTVQIGLEGLKILTGDGARAMRSYELGHISRWQSRGSSLVLYTKTPVDVEERQTTLTGDDTSIRNALDTLTCCCMQLCEILQSKTTESAKETANNLHALVAGGGKKKTSMPSADDIEYWHHPDKAGWLQCQGDHLRNWRKRWFVLKSGYLFRFKDATVSESTKPRGVVDLTKVQDVKEAKAITGRPNSFQLKTSTGGSVAYIGDSETELVEWMSAIEGAMARIMRAVAGVDDEPAPAPRRAADAPATTSNEWMRQLAKEYSSASGSGSGGGGSAAGGSNRSNNPLVNVVGYDNWGGGSSGNVGGNDLSSSSSRRREENRSSGGLKYDQITGVAGVVSAGATNDMDLNYGPRGGSNRPSGLSSASMDSYHPSAGAYGQSSLAANYGLQPTLSGSAPPVYPAAPMMQSYASAPSPTYAPPTSSAAAYPAGYGYGAPSPTKAGAYNQPPAQTYASAPAPGYGSGGGQGYAGQGSQYAQGSAYNGLTLLDTVPTATPAYPYFQHSAATAPSQPAPAPAAPSPAQWQVHYTGEGRPYYYNAFTGSTQWEAPMGMA